LAIELVPIYCYTPAVLCCRLQYSWFACLLLLVGLGLFASPLVAEEADRLEIFTASDVVRCSAAMGASDKGVLVALRDGIEVTTIWHIQVAGVRKYWLNDAVAEIELKRRVKPDLLSRSWLLLDEASGISRRVYAIASAEQFLFTLQEFPVLDRTLLKPAMPYRMQVKVELYQGEMNKAWWAGIWHPAKSTWFKDFQLP